MSQVGDKETVGETVGLREAAELFGVSVDTLRRRIRSGRLTEAGLAEGSFGEEYRLPVVCLGEVAAREGWDAPVRPGSGTGGGGQPVGIPGVPEDFVDRLVSAERRAAAAEAAVDSLEGAANASDGLVQRLRSDLEQERAELVRVQVESSAALRDAATAKARVEEIRVRVADLESLLAVGDKELGSARSELADGLAVQHDLESRLATSDALVVDLRGDLEAAASAMGWWSRRRLGRRTAT
ncbi:MAG: hypothetical protein GY701_00665 [Sulfitobacter sp.]|nr:hypothetical protein [Sulfitobacter sp.]